MAAPKGNKYNFKWNKDKAVKFMTDCLETVRKKKSINTTGDLYQYHDEFYPQLFPKLAKLHEDCALIKKEIEETIKTRLINKALSNDSNVTMSIFVLKNHHGMKDKQDIEVEGNVKVETITGFNVT